MKKQILFLLAAILLSTTSAFAQSGTTGPLTWNLSGKILTISGNGAMPNYSYPNYAPWHNYSNSITAIIIENGVTRIGKEAFSSCSGLSSATISISTISIEERAFFCCYSLTSISLPNSLENIGDMAFYMSGLTSITLPNSITSIGQSAFASTKLISVTLPNSLTSIGSSTFSDCTGLTSITLPNSITKIGGSCFSNCTGLASITLPNSITEIGGSCFSNCTGLNSITLPNSITNIGYSCFNGCTGLTSIMLPNSITEIGGSCFSNCTGFTSITLPNSLTEIGESCFSNCTGLTSITLPNGIASIKNNTFYNCTGLTSIALPKSITDIGYSCFYNCTGLSSISLPSNIIGIGKQSFYDCSNLTSITLPNSISYIGKEAFAWTGLTSITNLNSEPIGIESNVFLGVAQSICTLTVPSSAVSAYENAEVWKEFNIVGSGFLVNPISNNSEYGYTAGAGLYEANATATVMATAFTGNKFVNWTKNGAVISTENPYSFTVTEDVELGANFENIVGIENSENIVVKIYPNPTFGELTIESRELRINDVEIYDIYGKKLLSNHHFAPSSNHLINISHLPAGVYFVKIFTEAGEVTRKVVKE